MRGEVPASELFSGPLGGELARRILDATRAARDLCGESADVDVAANPDDLGRLIETLGLMLGDVGGEIATHRAAIVALRSRYDTRIDALERIHGSVLRLEQFGSPLTLLERAPRELAESSNFQRVSLSLIRSGVMHTQSAYVQDDQRASAAVLEAVQASPVRLARPLVEAEVLQLRRAAVVTGAQTSERAHRPLAVAMGWRTYVVAASFVRGRPVALLHADRGSSETVDVLDRDILWEFATGFARAYDRASLTAALRHERAAMLELQEWLTARVGDLSDASLDYVGREPLVLAGSGGRSGTPLALDDRRVFEGQLTRREIEVLRLLVAGRSNRVIGEELVLAAGTVKFHVNSILRKLGVANRAEAVARYLRLTGSPEI